MLKRLLSLVGLIGGGLFVIGIASNGGSAPNKDPNHPEVFRSKDAKFRDLNITTVYSIRREDNWIQADWPFVSDWVLIACAKPAMNIVKVGTSYAALNGNTSSQAERYEIQEQSGRRSAYFTTRSKDNLRWGEVVKYEASDLQIGAWWGAMNSTLLTTCD